MRKVFLAVLTTFILVSPLLAQIQSPQPIFKANETRPADAIVLFDGKDTSAWVRSADGKSVTWKVENGYMEVVPEGGANNIQTKESFGDCQLHIEFWLPLMADAQGQARSNSGVYLQCRDEIQVLDSYGLKSQNNDCGAIYSVAAPLVNACRPPEQWQTYDIIYRARRNDAQGNQVQTASFTVFQNGVLIHNSFLLPGPNAGSSDKTTTATGPLLLQDHLNKIRFRDIWIRRL